MKAFTKNVKSTPQKMCIVANTIRGQRADKAGMILKYMYKRAARILEKTLHSAIANATSKGADLKNLVVEEVRVGRGMIITRYMPRAKGRAGKIEKVRSNIGIILKEVQNDKKEEVKNG